MRYDKTYLSNYTNKFVYTIKLDISYASKPLNFLRYSTTTKLPYYIILCSPHNSTSTQPTPATCYFLYINPIPPTLLSTEVFNFIYNSSIHFVSIFLAYIYIKN